VVESKHERKSHLCSDFLVIKAPLGWLNGSLLFLCNINLLMPHYEYDKSFS
jgi:hypothetical protein